jgi:hypothetical protein
VHAYIISSLKKDMPAVFGKEAKKKELIKNLDTLYAALQRVSRMCWFESVRTRPAMNRAPHWELVGGGGGGVVATSW